MKKMTYPVLCFLLLFNFSRYVPNYRPDTGKEIEIVLPDNLTDQIRKDAAVAAQNWKKGKRK